mgnify:FL=1
MNILYIGSSGALSLNPFRTLLASKHSITAVGVFNPIKFTSKIIALENESLALSASQLNIPLIDLSRPINNILEQCKDIVIDVILMSCYSKRLPDEVIKLATKGCFNMHPSLLPRYRGPEPIFWQMKQASDVGVSWHRVVHDLDAGDVVTQQDIKLDDGLSYPQINQQLAEKGAELMLMLLSDLLADSLVMTTQDPELASYYPYPDKQDFVIEPSWTAQHIYNFMRATEAFGHGYLCQVDSYNYLLDKAVDYDNNDSLPDAEVKGDTLYIPCNAGVLIATYTAKL